METLTTGKVFGLLARKQGDRDLLMIESGSRIPSYTYVSNRLYVFKWIFNCNINSLILPKGALEIGH